MASQMHAHTVPESCVASVVVRLRVFYIKFTDDDVAAASVRYVHSTELRSLCTVTESINDNLRFFGTTNSQQLRSTSVAV